MKNLLLTLGMAMCVTLGHAQDFNDQDDDFESFRKSIHADFENFRKQCMEEYIDFVRNPWKEFKGEKPVPKPKEEPKPPVVMPEDDKDKPVDPKPVVIEEVVKPAPVVPQPKPVEPIEEVPVVKEATHSFTFFGTAGEVRFDADNKITLRGVSAKDIAKGLDDLSTEAYDNMIIDCLKIRSSHNLCDWAYLQMLKSLAESLYGKSTNEATLLIGYLYLQSGYQMRFGMNDGRLYMLYATPHLVYEQDSYVLNGVRYCGLEQLPPSLYIADVVYPKEQCMSLYINNVQLFAERMSQPRTIASKRFPDVSVQVRTNQNLMDFYSTYPTSMIGENVVSRWAMYANTPMDKEVAQTLYPQLKAKLEGRSQLEAVNILLNWVQTGFVYEYDDKVWGGDRAFFAEESLNYPYCDCEDRSILFTRLVRDLLGLECMLVFYPGHLASAVCFTEPVNGDYIQINGKNFIVSDPTYIGAPVGKTMPDMNNQTAKVIVLD